VRASPPSNIFLGPELKMDHRLAPLFEYPKLSKRCTTPLQHAF